MVQHKRTCRRELFMARNTNQTHSKEKEIFPTRLREIMKEKGTTQKELGDVLEVKRQTISLYTQGQSKPDSDGLKKIADYFNISADWLLGISSTKSTNTNIKAICEFTGLSDKAVEILEFLNKSTEQNKCNLISLLIEDAKPFDLFFKEHYGEKSFAIAEHKKIMKEYSEAHADVLECLWVLLDNPHYAIRLFYGDEFLPVDLLPKLFGKEERLCMFELQERILQFKKLIRKEEENESNGE